MGLMLNAPLAAFLLVLSAAGAHAMCPPPRSDAEHTAAGAVVFTGQVVRLAPPSSARLPEWAELKVLEDATGRLTGTTQRVLAPNNGIYTARFELGAIYRVVARGAAGALATSACDLRKQ